jgi:hypothetical protein
MIDIPQPSYAGEQSFILRPRESMLKTVNKEMTTNISLGYSMVFGHWID